MDMEKLMKPAEYAQETGISRQAVYAKIKRGILTAKNVEGKIYIVVDTSVAKEATPATEKTDAASKAASPLKPGTSIPKATRPDYEALLQSKDETISVLKGTVKDLKKSNKQISRTLKGEIDLLKEAFYEMRTLYVHQLEQKRAGEAAEAIEVISEEANSDTVAEKWIGTKKFFKQHKVAKGTEQDKIMKRLKKAYRSGDRRIKAVEDKLKLNADKSYKDLLK